MPKALRLGRASGGQGFWPGVAVCGFGKTQEEILVRRDQYAPSDVCEKMADFTARALAGEPLAYILEEWDFYGMTLYVNRDVLIPRDDTCAVTELAMKKGPVSGSGSQDPGPVYRLRLHWAGHCQEGERRQGDAGGHIPGGAGSGEEKRCGDEADWPGQLHSGQCAPGPICLFRDV